MNAHLNRLHKLQKKIMYSLTFSDYITQAKPLMDRPDVLTIFMTYLS